MITCDKCGGVGRDENANFYCHTCAGTGDVPGYTHTANGRTWRLYGCAKRGCDKVNPDYLSFGTHEGLGYCLDHIPWRSRWRLWWQERRA